MMKRINWDYLNNASNHRKLLQYLGEFVTNNRKARIEEVLANRTRKLTIVLEDIYKPHNASAVLRTAECFGVQDIHLVEQNHEYAVNPYVTRGAASWLTLHRYNNPTVNNISACMDDLRKGGYGILATSVNPKAESIENVQPARKTAVIFGTEYEGISSYVQQHADGFIKIPMLGFTESYNLSVSVAIILQMLMPQIRKLDNWNLSEDEKDELRLDWYRQIVKNSEIHIKRFNELNKSGF